MVNFYMIIQNTRIDYTLTLNKSIRRTLKNYRNSVNIKLILLLELVVWMEGGE